MFSTIIIPLVLLAVTIDQCASLGCITDDLCEGTKNEIRACPDQDGTCGSFNGRRYGNRIIPGVDLKCGPNQRVHAPFDGELYYWRPHGGQKDLECMDKGVRIEGTGQWQGYYALIAYVDPHKFGKVEKGEEIGVSISLVCSNYFANEHGFDNHIQFTLYKQGVVVDPTFHLTNCMCTGQICESNPTNNLIGGAFKLDERYNIVKGWELECGMMRDVYDGDGNMINPEDRRERVPYIRSPIEGKYIGRIRLESTNRGNNRGGMYTGCHNDGIVIKGKGPWKNFEVRMYNVRLRSDSGAATGNTHVVVGQNIGTRLDCGDSPASMFMEVRYRGRFINMTDAILAKNCSMPQLLP